MNRREIYFTLIELLVVISIIAVLAGMLLPALNNARRSAKKIQCSGNVKHLALAQILYAGSYNDYMTGAWNQRNGDANQFWFANLTLNGLISPKILACPDNNLNVEKVTSYPTSGSEKYWTNGNIKGLRRTYLTNRMLGCLYSNTASASNRKLWKLSNFKKPSMSAVHFCAQWGNVTDSLTCSADGVVSVYYLRPNMQSSQVSRPVHNNSYVMGFADGHVSGTVTPEVFGSQYYLRDGTCSGNGANSVLADVNKPSEAWVYGETFE